MDLQKQFTIEAVVLTCSWSQQPAVQVTSSHAEIKYQSPLAVNGVQDVLHCYWSVGVCILLACLPLHQEVSKGSCTTPLCHCQSLIMVACDGEKSVLINRFEIKLGLRCKSFKTV